MTETMQRAAMSRAIEVSEHLLDTWATDSRGPVALHLRQKLVPVGEHDVIFPPTYADIGYNIDTLCDGTKVATIDSVGSQANRMEPVFRDGADGDNSSLSKLVPQIEIVFLRGDKRSILDLAHRGADAVVQSSPGLSEEMAKAFDALRRTGDAGPLCSLAPTSLVFGVWDSRGGTGEKRPRIVRSVIRAWDVETLHSAAQFTSVWRVLDEEQRSHLEKEAKRQKVKLSEKGLADAPATFRKVGTNAGREMREFRDGAPNPERRILGGVLVRGRIERDVTVNLIALRSLRGKDDGETSFIRRYLLALSLLAATAEIDLFLREGCHLRYSGEDVWHSVPRRGDPTVVNLGSQAARALVAKYASTAADHFRPWWPKTLEYQFDVRQAAKLLAKGDEEGPGEE